MRADLRELVFGRLVYEEPVPALDDVRFERVLRGFAGHYDVVSHDASRFSFTRGEGYQKFERWDGFAYVDRGSVERTRDWGNEGRGAKVVMLPLYDGLRFELGMRVIFAFWAFALLCGWLILGGAALFWGFALLLLYAMHVWLVVRSLRAKLARWLARESWN